jgi:hypothetical protein
MVIWKRKIDISSEVETFVVNLPLQDFVPAGNAVGRYFHDHDYITWPLLRVEVER